MGYEVYKNASVSEDNFDDLAGNTVQEAYAGELTLGSSDFLSQNTLDLDDTEATFPAEDEVLSITLVCDLCGKPVDSKAELTKVGSYYRCEDCLDG